MVDLAHAAEFMQTHGRLIDRRRFDFLFGDGDADAALAALSGHANADGGFGWALEPDLRGASSQPAGALHAFEVLEEIAPATSPLAARLCDWLDSASLADGGLPFALPGAGAGSAPFWVAADPSRSSLHITGAVCGIAHRVADHDPAVAAHAWLRRATDYCLKEIQALERPAGTTGGAIEFQYVLQFLDALCDENADAARELDRLGASIPASGSMAVKGGLEDEKLTPLDFAPLPDRPLRRLFEPELVARDLDRVEAEQHDDGGWDVDFRSYSPAGALEWRGYATVRALTILRANDRLERAA
jgi:hypothetical protein